MAQKIRELNGDEETSVQNIIKELAGYTVEQAETIIKTVAAKIKECAIVEGE